MGYRKTRQYSQPVSNITSNLKALITLKIYLEYLRLLISSLLDASKHTEALHAHLPPHLHILFPPVSNIKIRHITPGTPPLIIPLIPSKVPPLSPYKHLPIPSRMQLVPPKTMPRRDPQLPIPIAAPLILCCILGRTGTTAENCIIIRSHSLDL